MVMAKRTALCIVLLLFSCYSLTHADSSEGCLNLSEAGYKCYYDLEESLLESESNRVRLTRTYFPPENNVPEFVTVTYHFEDGNDDHVWFWSAQTSHFLHPFKVFQFLSLLFNKPEPFNTGSLYVNLTVKCESLDCNLQLLTQRLKLYAERGTGVSSNTSNLRITLRDTYSAKAYNSESLKSLLKKNKHRTTNVIICTATIVTFLFIVIIFLMLFTFYKSNSHTRSEWINKVKEKQPAVLSFTVVSGLINVYIISLASAAVNYWCQITKKSDSESDLFQYDPYGTRNLGPVVTALCSDVVCFVIFLVLLGLAFYFYFIEHKDTEQQNGNKNTEQHVQQHTKHNTVSSKDRALISLSLTILCPLFCIIAHSPYIIIAYLNDGDHASSMLIYYTILVYIFFGVTWLFFHWLEHYISNDQETNPNADKERNKDTEDKTPKEAKAKDTANKTTEGDTRIADDKTPEEGTTPKVNADNENTEGKTPEGAKEQKDTVNKATTGTADKKALEGVTGQTVEKRDGCFFYVMIMFMVATIGLMLGVVTVIACYFVFIPINKAISDAPSRVLSIYQSGGFIIGSFIVYKVLGYFYSKGKEDEEEIKKICLTVEKISNTLILDGKNLKAQASKQSSKPRSNSVC